MTTLTPQWNAVSYNFMIQTIQPLLSSRFSGDQLKNISECFMSNLVLLDPSIVNPSNTQSQQQMAEMLRNCISSSSLYSKTVSFNTTISSTWNNDIENQFKNFLYNTNNFEGKQATIEQVDCGLNYLKNAYLNPNDAIPFLVQDINSNNSNCSILKCVAPTVAPTVAPQKMSLPIKILIGGGGILLIIIVILILRMKMIKRS